MRAAPPLLARCTTAPARQLAGGLQGAARRCDSGWPRGRASIKRSRRATSGARDPPRLPPASAGGTYNVNTMSCSNGARPACDPGLTWVSSYDVCAANPYAPLCPMNFAVNGTRPISCNPICPGTTGAPSVPRTATDAGKSVQYCAAAVVPYTQAASSGACFSMPPAAPPLAPAKSPPPAAPITVCALPLRISPPTRKCPSGERRGAPTPAAPPHLKGPRCRLRPCAAQRPAAQP